MSGLHPQQREIKMQGFGRGRNTVEIPWKYCDRISRADFEDTLSDVSIPSSRSAIVTDTDAASAASRSSKISIASSLQTIPSEGNVLNPSVLLEEGVQPPKENVTPTNLSPCPSPTRKIPRRGILEENERKRQGFGRGKAPLQIPWQYLRSVSEEYDTETDDTKSNASIPRSRSTVQSDSDASAATNFSDISRLSSHSTIENQGQVSYCSNLSITSVEAGGAQSPEDSVTPTNQSPCPSPTRKTACISLDELKPMLEQAAKEWVMTYGHGFNKEDTDDETDSEEVRALKKKYPYYRYGHMTILDDDDDGWTTAKDTDDTASTTSKDNEPVEKKRHQNLLTVKSKLKSGDGGSVSDVDANSLVSYGSSRVKKIDPNKVLAATKTLKNNVEKLSINTSKFRLKFEDFDDSDEGSAFFSLDGNLQNILRCRIDPEKSLKDTTWWIQNACLLQGREELLRRTFYEFIRYHTSGEIIVIRHHLDNSDIASGIYNMTVDIVKTDEDIQKFEAILIDNSKPFVEKGEMKKGYMISLQPDATVLLGLENSFLPSIMAYLKNPELKSIIEPRDKSNRIKYEMFYEDYKVKNFLAPLRGNWYQLYRVEILERLQKTHFYELPKYKVLYIDLGWEAKVYVDEFACLTQSTTLPPLLDKLPPQLLKCQLYGLAKIDYPLSRCFNMNGQCLMIKSVESAIIKMNVDTDSLDPEWDEPSTMLPSRVILFRCAKDNENCQNIVSLNQYLRIVGESEFSFKSPKISKNVQKALRTLWKDFENEKDSLSFKDKLYEQYFFSTTGIMMNENEEEEEEQKVDKRQT